MADEPTTLRSISKNMEEGLGVAENAILDFELMLLVDLFLGFSIYIALPVFFLSFVVLVVHAILKRFS